MAGKVVIDNNNCMVWRDGHFPEVDSGRKTIHELRQDQLPASKIVKAFTHVQFHERKALVVSSDFPSRSSWSPAATTRSDSTRSTTAR